MASMAEPPVYVGGYSYHPARGHVRCGGGRCRADRPDAGRLNWRSAARRVQLLEERIDMPNITRAFAVHARTLELLDARGMADELLTRGAPVYEIAPPGGATIEPAGAADQIRRCC